ncbi:hypothetical protein [Egbenema bharatensis]|uniref:hypothetical protein n=1 Tax=Egbenema bharatensis TaxID=3463334 RepID=UPI003A8B9522
MFKRLVLASVFVLATWSTMLPAEQLSAVLNSLVVNQLEVVHLQTLNWLAPTGDPSNP